MLKYDVVDVFAERPFAGNQLAVVHGAEGLSDTQLQQLAQEFNFSETTFPSGATGSSYDVRIFTPGRELPFAGHPTLGTAWVLRETGLLVSESVVQHCGAGDYAVTFGDGLVRLSAMPVSVEEVAGSVAAELVARFGLSEDDLVGAAYVASAGLPFHFLEVTEDAVSRARPSSRPLPDGGPDGVAFYALSDEDDQIVSSHTRVFVPGLAVPEDPATGSAAAGFGLVLAASGVLPEGGDYVIRQGAEMGRPSVLHGTVFAAAGVARRVDVAGAVHRIASGSIAIPA